MGGAPADRAPARLAPATTPAPIENALTAHGMNQGGNFTPGRPLQPYFGYSAPARAQDYPVGVNIATQGRAAWGKVSFDVLKALIDAYDVARMCINHKIDELRSMPLMFQPAHGVEDDVEDAIDAARLVLDKPDRELPYDAWLSKWLENALKYDACPLYKRRDYNGDIIGLEVVDGRTIAPYIDEHGRRPKPPAPAFWQVIHGMVGTWFTTDDLIYTPFRPQEDSPYGLAPIESVVLTANTDIRFQWHFLQLFTDGSVPAGFMELPPDVSEPAQVREWQDHWDAMVMGDQAKLHQLLAVPNGSKYTGTKPATFDPKFPEWLMKRTCAAFGVVPQDLGLVSDVNRANGETQVDIQFRVNTLPWVRFVEGTLSRYLQHDIGLPVKVSLDTGRDKEDRLQEAQAHQLYVEMGAESPDEVRVDILGKKVDKERPTPRFFSTQRLGPVTLLAIEGAAGKTDPETYGPAKGQLVLDQPYVPPIPVVPTPGTTDDKASQAAIDAYQVQTRRALESQQDPNRETPAQREQRGAQQPQPGTGDAPLRSAPQGSQTQQRSAGQQEPVAKGADLSGAEAAELLAFREYVTGCKRRGRWSRDFVFKAVSPVVASELNRGGRAEVSAVLKAKAQPTAKPAPKDSAVPAREVYNQLAENFPADSIGWVLEQHWTREDLPLDRVDWSNLESWRASREPGKVAKLARRMAKGKDTKPSVAVQRPGQPTVMVADGHHHALAHRSRHEPVPAYVAHPKRAEGPWDELHAHQDPDADVTKAAGPKAAGIAVRAADTGRILMLQRGMDESDPASGTWEFPGGCLEPGEQPHAAASREWEEEVGSPLPDGAQTGAWTSSNGVYAGFVWTVPHEGVLRIDDPRDRVINPDDPGRDHVEAIAWWDPEQLVSNPAVRRELAADMPRVLAALRSGVAKAATLTKAQAHYRDPSDVDGRHCGNCSMFRLNPPDFESGACTLVQGAIDERAVCDHWEARDGVTKADGDPKDQARSDDWPGWRLDLAAIAHWAPLLAADMLAAIDAAALASAYLTAQPAAAHTDDDQDKRQRLIDATVAFLLAWGVRSHLAQALARDMAGLWTDGYLIGDSSARAILDAVADGTPLDQAVAEYGDWEAGRTDIAEMLIGEWGDGSGLRELLDAQGIEIRSIAQSRLEDLARLLADGVLRGVSAEDLAEEIKALLGNQARARLIATTEISRASSAAAMRAYRRAGVKATRQITVGDARVCVICDENAAAGAVPIGTPYPSGDLQCPVHPGDRCANIPA
jgi:8-oxo-dGTP pyrophosphatase MutT (NUDIX family)